MSTRERAEEETLLEGQRIFNGPRKLGEILFGSSSSEETDGEE
jgi:hypothetical protein